jgi:hypothetical protein
MVNSVFIQCLCQQDENAAGRRSAIASLWNVVTAAASRQMSGAENRPAFGPDRWDMGCWRGFADLPSGPVAWHGYCVSGSTRALIREFDRHTGDRAMAARRQLVRSWGRSVGPEVRLDPNPQPLGICPASFGGRPSRSFQGLDRLRLRRRQEIGLDLAGGLG